MAAMATIAGRIAGALVRRIAAIRAFVFHKNKLVDYHIKKRQSNFYF